MALLTNRVSIRLGDADYDLIPSINAALVLSRGPGGLKATIDAVQAMNLEAIVQVVQVGLDREVARKLNDQLPELVWSSGLLSSDGGIVLRCVEYLVALSYGGRRQPNLEASDDTARPPN